MPVEKRSYQMTARADAAAATGERILDAVVELFWESPANDFTLDAVAERSGVTVQTVIRRFGGRQGAWEAAVERETSKVVAHRGQAPPGDVLAAVAILVEHYELVGDAMMRLLAQESRSAVVESVVETGRVVHRQWCQNVFGPLLTGLKGVDRKRRLAQFVAVCDLQTWNLLRRSQRLSRAQTERALIEMLAPFTNERK